MSLFQTERLLIQRIKEEDASFIYELMNSPGWLKYIGDRGISKEMDAKNYIKKTVIPSYNKYGFGSYKICLKETSSAIGTCGLFQRDYLEYPDLGFAILPEFERKGYTFEASQAVLNHAVIDIGLKTILAIANLNNAASLQLLLKLGFEKQNTMTLKETSIQVLRKDL